MTNPKRIQLELLQASYERLLFLKTLTEASSSSEVIRHALRVYEYLILETQKGCNFYSEDEKGVKREVKFF
jgi:hypothetical protein